MASEVSGTAGAAGDGVAWWCWVIMSRVRPAAGPPEAGTGPPRSAGRSRSRTRSSSAEGRPSGSLSRHGSTTARRAGGTASSDGSSCTTWYAVM